MKINDKVDFSSDMNLPKKTISTNADLTKKESFFLARIQDVRRYREVLSKNKLSNVIYNILENPMVIRNELSPTYIQNKILKQVSKFLIVMAMSAIGLNTNIITLIKNGGKPILMGFCCWIAIILMSLCYIFI